MRVDGIVKSAIISSAVSYWLERWAGGLVHFYCHCLSLIRGLITFEDVSKIRGRIVWENHIRNRYRSWDIHFLSIQPGWFSGCNRKVQRRFLVPCRFSVLQLCVTSGSYDSSTRCSHSTMKHRFMVVCKVGLKLVVLLCVEKVSIMSTDGCMLGPRHTWCWQGRWGR